MDLQERLIELSEYGANLNVANGNFVIKIKYDSKWSIIQPDGDEIAFYRDENDSSVYYYVAPVSISIDKIFAAIDETIDYNKELEQKVVLFKQKMEELQDIFAKESLEVLNTLEFKVKKKKVANNKKEKQTKEEVEEQTEAKNEVESTTVEETKETEKEEKKEDKLSEIDDKISKILNNK